MYGLPGPQQKLAEVREMLLGARQHYSASFLDRDTGDINVYEALRYLFEAFLEWSPTQVRDCLSIDIIRLFKMEPLINRLPCPPELDRNRDFEYVAWYLYPETVNCTKKDLAIKVYHRLIKGEITRFPKGYFDGTIQSWFRARCAFQCMLIEYMPPFPSLEALYAYFTGSKGREAIRKYKLLVPLRELYDSPLDYLHDSLSSQQRSEELYQKYKAIQQKYSRKYKITEDDGGECDEE